LDARIARDRLRVGAPKMVLVRIVRMSLRLYSMRNCLLSAFAALKFSMMHSSDGVPAFSVGRVRWPRTGLSSRAARRLGHPALIPRAIMGRSPEALAFGSRRHFIPASLSLPLCGCLVNRSCDCSRSRVPPLSAGGAMLTLLRLPLSPACASLRHDLVGYRWRTRFGGKIQRYHRTFRLGPRGRFRRAPQLGMIYI
jgi:hypothetical protein